MLKKLLTLKFALLLGVVGLILLGISAVTVGFGGSQWIVIVLAIVGAILLLLSAARVTYRLLKAESRTNRRIEENRRVSTRQNDALAAQLNELSQALKSHTEQLGHAVGAVSERLEHAGVVDIAPAPKPWPAKTHGVGEQNKAKTGQNRPCISEGFPRGMAPAKIEVLGDRPRFEGLDFHAATQRLTWDAAVEERNYLPVPSNGSFTSIDVTNCVEAKIRFGIRLAKGQTASAKAAVLTAKVFDAKGVPFETVLLKTPHHKYGSYSYLGGSSHAFSGYLEFRLALPNGAAKLEVGIVPWDRHIELVNLLDVHTQALDPEQLRRRSTRQVRVATVLDEFSFDSFKYECVAIPVEPGNWREQFERHKPELFLCESAWSGEDSKRRPWKGRVYTSSNFAKENRTDLLDILRYCREHRIPTVFWNKEDPTHYEDRVHDFVDSAIKFDHIFTTAEECVERYKTEYGHSSVGVLPFAVQPRMFNPISAHNRKRSSDVIFAGGWYANHELRSQEMEVIFDSIIQGNRELKIYDRFSGSGDPLHQFPDRFKKYIHNSVPFAKMGDVYCESDIGITINTVTDSKSMIARRIFELAASGTYIVSNEATGVREFFGDNVTIIDGDEARPFIADGDEISKAIESNLQLVLSKHTYAHRLRTILDTAGILYDATAEEPLTIVAVKSIEEARASVQTLKLNLKPGRHGVVLVGDDVSPLESAQIFAELHGGAISVVDLRMWRKGKLTDAQVVGTAQDFLLCDADSLHHMMDKAAELSVYRSFWTKPIRSADGVPKRTVKHSELSLNALVGLSDVKKTLQLGSEMEKCDESTVYV